MKLFGNNEGLGNFKYLCRTRRRFHLINVSIMGGGVSEILFYNLKTEEMIKRIKTSGTIEIGCTTKEGINRLREVFPRSTVRICASDPENDGKEKATCHNFMIRPIYGYIAFSYTESDLPRFFRTLIELRKENFRAIYRDSKNVVYGYTVIK